MWYDDPIFCNETRPRARKRHRCCECGKAIAEGEQYVRLDGFWSGDFRTYKLCMECNGMRDFLQAHLDCECYLGGLYDCMGGAGFTKNDVLSMMAAKAKKEQNNG